MNEWILVLTMTLSAPQGQVRDMSPQLLSGFTAKETCQVAGSAISNQLILLTGKARESQGIPGNTPASRPSIWFECMQVRK